jgi:predicted nucleic acid-binding protein
VDDTNTYVQAFRAHLESNDRVFLIGNILQELLDGLRSPKQFSRLVQIMEPFPLLTPNRSTYVAAAELRTACRAKGVSAGSIDFLIAAACSEHGYPLLTADQDFSRIAECSDLVVLPG